MWGCGVSASGHIIIILCYTCNGAHTHVHPPPSPPSPPPPKPANGALPHMKLLLAASWPSLLGSLVCKRLVHFRSQESLKIAVFLPSSWGFCWGTLHFSVYFWVRHAMGKAWETNIREPRLQTEITLYGQILALIRGKGRFDKGVGSV